MNSTIDALPRISPTVRTSSLPFSTPRFSFQWKVLSCILLILLADWFFYGDGPDHFGWTLGGWCAALLLGGALHQRFLISPYGKLIALLTLGLSLALIENPNLLAFLLLSLGLLSLATLQNDRWIGDARMWIKYLFLYSVTGLGRLFSDILTWMRVRSKTSNPTLPKFSFKKWASYWLIPISFSILFILLFSAANPLVKSWLQQLEWISLFQFFSVRHILFWLSMALISWPILRPRVYSIPYSNPSAPPKLTHPMYDFLFNPSSIVRALFVFNLIFLVQTVTDLIYLWGEETLPEGLSHADYAHRGAYPLILTALLAALFVLIALRPNSPSEQSPTIRTLVYLWVLQNVFLVLSCIWRTYLYVQAFGAITYWRVAALVWMGLVAAGLLFIMIQILARRSNLWLININILTLLAVLYLCSFINFSNMIAWYNVQHCAEITGKGEKLDLLYLQKLGPSALSALYWYRDQALKPKDFSKTVYSSNGSITVSVQKTAEYWAEDTIDWNIQWLEDDLRNSVKDWRGWTFRKYRMFNELHLAP